MHPGDELWPLQQGECRPFRLAKRRTLAGKFAARAAIQDQSGKRVRHLQMGPGEVQGGEIGWHEGGPRCQRKQPVTTVVPQWQVARTDCAHQAGRQQVGRRCRIRARHKFGDDRDIKLRQRLMVTAGGGIGAAHRNVVSADAVTQQQQGLIAPMMQHMPQASLQVGLVRPFRLGQGARNQSLRHSIRTHPQRPRRGRMNNADSAAGVMTNGFLARMRRCSTCGVGSDSRIVRGAGKKIWHSLTQCVNLV